MHYLAFYPAPFFSVPIHYLCSSCLSHDVYQPGRVKARRTNTFLWDILYEANQLYLFNLLFCAVSQAKVTHLLESASISALFCIHELTDTHSWLLWLTKERVTSVLLLWTPSYRWLWHCWDLKLWSPNEKAKVFFSSSSLFSPVLPLRSPLNSFLKVKVIL